VHILVANGNAGEFYALTRAETETSSRSAEQIGERIPLLGAAVSCVVDACALAKASRVARDLRPPMRRYG
jgi:4-hydroxy-tetrahydrodipicolinate synthase